MIDDEFVRGFAYNTAYAGLGALVAVALGVDALAGAVIAAGALAVDETCRNAIALLADRLSPS